VSGPDCGGVWDLAPGDHIVGRSGSICWNDAVMSRRHLMVHAGATTIEVTDLGSSHGTRIDGERCVAGERVPWPVDATLEIGTSVAILRHAPPADGLWEPADPGWRQLLRPPRLPTHVDVPVIEVPPPPAQPEKRALPWVAIAVPLLLGVGIALALQRPEYLLFVVASPVMVLANYLAVRIGSRRRSSTASAAHELKLKEAETQVARAITAEQRDLRERQPDAAAMLLTVLLPGRRLWERRPGDADFLRLRVGCGDRPSAVVVKGLEADDRVARLVPQSVDLGSESILGITGATAVGDGVLRWMVAQLAAHHRPRDLSLVFLGIDGDPDWAWVRWLPHRRSDLCGVQDLIRDRREKPVSGRERPKLPAVVVVVRGFADVSRAVDLRDIVEQGPAAGVHVLCTAAVDGELPDQARVMLSTASSRNGYGSLAGKGSRIDSILLDQVSVRWATRCARGLAPFRDAVGADRATIPDDVRLLDLLGRRSETSDVIAGWRSQPRSTTAVLGATAEGPLTLDLKTDGPHALIAGMTGSGKTKLLQTLIASLALANHPQSLTFVLIDYKGDSAFQECERLPHVVGKVTDLNPSLVERALISLRAELDRRKTFLAEAAVSDIDSYDDLSLREQSRPTLPRLVLVIDEFAELAKELPEFVDGLVSIAQLGRSLGVHLVLATQRPNGVLSPAIRANTNIRIALRVADPADSVDVLGVADASTIPSARPGRGYLALGGQPAAEFQTAQPSGGHTSVESRIRREPVIAPLGSGGSLGLATRARAVPPRREEAVGLSALVDCIRSAARAEGLPPQRRPWLDPLPARLPWPRPDALPMAGPTRFPFGLADLPDRQRQEVVCIDLVRDGHAFFVGAARSGRSHALRVVGAAIAEFATPDDVHLYGIDCGAGDLAALASMPQCGAVVARHEGERVGRLLGRLTSELARRQAISTNDLERASPRIVLMIDRWEGFLSAFAEMADCVDTVMRLLREGAGVGIHLVITGDRALITNPRMGALTEAKYVLRLAERGDYALAGFHVRHISTDMPPGRCFGPGKNEIQVFSLDREPVCRVATAGRMPFRVDPLPSRIGATEAFALLPSAGIVPRAIVGVGGDTLTAFALDLGKPGWFAVVGPPGSGRSAVLAGAAESGALTGAEVLAITPRQSAADVVGMLEQASDRATLLIVDDVEEVAHILDGLVTAVRTMRPCLFVMIGGTAEGVGYGFSGWRSELRRAGRGLLLSPRSVAEGDLVGARLTRSAVGGGIRPGRGLLHLGGGVLTPVATLAPSLT
jgi:S-DNA-T family DNA segregation ATPase FtsK/SpoIIIE